MKIVTQIEMDGPRPDGPKEWDGRGFHPILGMTMEEIKAAAAHPSQEYLRADSEDKIKPLTLEEEARVMEIKAKEMQEAHFEALSASLSK